MENMLLRCTAIPLALLLGSTATAMEAPSSELKVIGAIVPEPCTVTLGNGGVMDFGTISAGLIQPNAETQLTGTKTEKLIVTCPTPATVAFSAADNRAGSASPDSNALYSFGFGNVNSEGKLGRYTALVKNLQVDGASASATSTTGTRDSRGLRSGTTDRALYLTAHDQQYAWSPNSRSLRGGQVFTADVEVTAFIASSAAMKGTLTEDIPLDGSLTLNFLIGL